MESAMQILSRRQAIITGGHFVYKSGHHGSAYVNKDAIYPHVRDVSMLCRQMAENFMDDEVEAVIGPVQGGIILAQFTTLHLTDLCGQEILAVFADKTESGGFCLKRGYDKLVAGKKVLAVEDVITTGGSIKAVVNLVKSAGGDIVGISALCNRGAVTVEQLGVKKFISLAEADLTTYPADQCPLCQAGIPVRTDLGKGKEFLAAKAK